MEEAFLAQLLATSGVTAIVGTRVRPVMAGQADNPPRVVVTTISRNPVYHAGGQSDLADARVQVDCWATTATGAIALARAVKAAIPKQPFTRSGVDFGGVFQISERQSFEGDDATSRIHRVSIDFRVWHSSP